MKAKHKAIVAKASRIRTEIADKVVAASKLATTLGAVTDDIAALKSQMSEIQSEAADSGLSVADLNAELDNMRVGRK